MTLNRRDLLTGIAGVAAAGAVSRLPTAAMAALSFAGASEFPRKRDFAIAEGCTYLNAPCTHPMPLVASAAARKKC